MNIRVWRELYTTNGVYLITPKGRTRKQPFRDAMEMIISQNTDKEEKVWAVFVSGAGVQKRIKK
jgi:hypothetical protein